MSVYRQKRSPYWQYDFTIEGVRHRGNTKAADKATALAIEARIRTDYLKKSRLGILEPISWRHACGRYWEEHGQHRKSTDTIFYQLENICDGLGKDKLLAQTSNDDITQYVARRRADVSDSSVNRELTLMKAIFNRADELWNRDAGKMPNWGKHRLTEPEGRTRYLKRDEERRLFAALPDYLGRIVHFCLLTGARFGNAARLTWSDIDIGEGILTFRDMKARETGKQHEIPLFAELTKLIEEQRGRHPIYVFSFKCQKSRGKRQAGEFYPFSRTGWRRAWRRALAEAGIHDFRFHDLRHSAATRMLRATGNIAVVKEVLGHKCVETTMRYAHVLNDDKRAALEAACQTMPIHGDKREAG
jgi:integrase